MNTPPPPPHRSRLTLTPRDPGLTVHLPARGIRGAIGASVLTASTGGAGLFMLATTALDLLTGQPFNGGVAVGLVAGGVFLLGGALLAAFATALATERAELDLIDNTLLITRQNRFRTKQHEFHAKEIQSVGSDSYNPARKNPNIRCLRITPEEDRTLELFLNRPTADLEYLADLIRTQLNLHDDDFDDEDEDEVDGD